METLLYYLIKSSILLISFYLCYQFLLRKETLFQFNRFFLLSGIVLSTGLPLIYFNKEVVVTNLPILNTTESLSETKILSTPETDWFLDVLGTFYLIGTLFLFFKLILQLKRLKQFLNQKNNPSQLKTNHIISDENIQPFSFFQWIIYNPQLHSKPALEAIISHEQVHANQLHSLDILLTEVFCILHWFNPVVWFYRTSIKQNLEFLADAHNNPIKTNKKEYQYILLNQSITNHQLALVNPFFNSLIKKRIVMINQNPSHKLNALKGLLILPALAIFLMSFNVKKNYIFNDSYTENNVPNRLEFVIDKATTDTELLKMKSDLAKVQYDFSYTTVRNKDGEIENLSIEISGGNKAKGEVSSTYNSASDNDTISPTYIFVDTAINKISIGNGTAETSKKQVTLNGSIVSENQVVNSKKQVVIRSGGEEDADVTIIEEEGGGFLSTDTDNDKEPLFYIDGKETDSEVIKNLNPNEIKSMIVLKGVSAVEKYGEKAKNGVIEITTKK